MLVSGLLKFIKHLKSSESHQIANYIGHCHHEKSPNVESP